MSLLLSSVALGWDTNRGKEQPRNFIRRCVTRSRALCRVTVARNTWQKPFCLFVPFSSPLRASRQLRRTRRSTPGGMSKVFALIINSLFSALPTHQRSPGAIRLSKKSLLRISTVELPITPTSYSSPSSHLLLQNPSQSGASRRTVDGGAFSRGPDLLLSARCHRFDSVSVQGGRRPSRDIYCICVVFARRVCLFIALLCCSKSTWKG